MSRVNTIDMMTMSWDGAPNPIFLRYAGGELTKRQNPTQTVITPTSVAYEDMNAANPVIVDHIGAYLLSGAAVFNHNFVEIQGEPFLEPGVMIPYAESLIRNGGLNWKGLRALRPETKNVSGSVLFLGGSLIFGDFLMDTWPRAWLAKSIFGPSLDGYKVLMADNTPSWSSDFISRVLRYSKTSFETYKFGQEVVECEKLAVPTHIHNNYAFHPLMASFLGDVKRDSHGFHKWGYPEKLYVSRRSFRGTSTSIARTIDDDLIEGFFDSHNFAIVRPENYTIEEQAALFRSARMVAGEAGSGLHGSIFSDSRPSVIQLGENSVQSQIAAFLGQKLVVVMPMSDVDGHRVYGIEQLEKALSAATQGNGASL